MSVIVDGHQASYELDPAKALVLGRASDCDIVIAHGSVSRRHARLSLGGNAMVEDLGSGNGTKVNGVRLPPNVPTVLAPGALVEIGSALVVVRGLTTVQQGGSTPARGSRAGDVSLEQWIELVAGSDITVLVLGETGVGKGVVAEAIHARSARAGRPLLALNCGALAESLLEAELFGNEKGAFTGAVTARPGMFEAASGGTLFLDEIGELSPTTQVKLLRALEDREVMRVGGRTAVPIDVRFIAATNRDLESMVADGTFRRDLFYRLNAVSIRVPPLRERRGELASLVERLLAKLSPNRPVAVGDGVLEVLGSHRWPGNVRELRNVLERAVLLARGGPIAPEHLLFDRGPAPPARPPEADEAPPLREAVQNLERARIVEALEQAAGNQTRAATLLGVSRRTLVRWLDEHRLPRPRKSDDA